MAKRKPKKLRHLLLTMRSTACGKPTPGLPPGSIATLLEDVTCEVCNASLAMQDALRNRAAREGSRHG